MNTFYMGDLNDLNANTGDVKIESDINLVDNGRLKNPTITKNDETITYTNSSWRDSDDIYLGNNHEVEIGKPYKLVLSLNAEHGFNSDFQVINNNRGNNYYQLISEKIIIYNEGASATYEAEYKILESRKYNIIFDNNIDSTNVIQIMTYDKEENLMKNEFERVRYRFVGWNTKADGEGTAFEDQAVINICNDLTLYAQWEQIKFPITSVALSNTEITLSVDKDRTKTLTATVEPSNAEDDKTITWSSSDSSVAKVNQSGKVTAVAKGEAVITATSSNGLTATCNVVVNGRTGWVTENGQKYYATVETGAYKGIKEVDGEYYHFGENSGQVKIGWSQTLNGKLYSFNEDYSIR